MEINGLPLHVLVVHAAVVFGPLSALSGIAYAVVPSWRDRLRWPTLVLVLIATGAIWTAALSGENFLETADRFKGVSGEAAELIHDHEELGEMLRNVVSGYAVVTVLATWLHTRQGAVRYLLSALVVAGAIGTLVYTILAGDAGAQAVWS